MSARTFAMTAPRLLTFGLCSRPVSCGRHVRELLSISRSLSSTKRHSAPTEPTTNGPNSSLRSPKSIPVSAEKGHEILSNQRLNRPVAPHLGVYKLQQTWFGSSAWMRITGCTLSGAVYACFISYLAAPAFVAGGFDSSALVSAFAGLPKLAQDGVKFGLAFPFVFHFFNGVKQLAYDAGFGYKKGTIKRNDFYLWGVALFVTPWIVFWL